MSPPSVCVSKFTNILSIISTTGFDSHGNRTFSMVIACSQVEVCVCVCVCMCVCVCVRMCAAFSLYRDNRSARNFSTVSRLIPDYQPGHDFSVNHYTNRIRAWRTFELNQHFIPLPTEPSRTYCRR